MNKIRYCQNCKEYTLEKKCLRCKKNTIVKIPPRYSPKTKIAEYRRKMRKEILKKRGLL